MSDKSISFQKFDNALNAIAEVTAVLKALETKDEAVSFLMKETNEPYESCSGAYDFYMKLFQKGKTEEK